MNAAALVPVHVAPEAAARVAELNLQGELDRVIEHTLQSMPRLRRINVVLFEPYDAGNESGITIEAVRDEDAFALEDPIQREWSAWLVKTFPPEVCEHFGLVMLYEESHAG